MKLPNADKARVDKTKITEYLLNKSHPDGCSKASFFCQFGFTLENWEIFAQSLCRHAKSHNVTKVVESKYGTRYSIDGYLETPDGRNPEVRSIWITEKQSTIPRLITVHPK
ncbi:MAG: hypothetical protein SCARUB_02933 [Candidatus Scalindua rubra]|uniref:DUF6883 domain-containing protein n=1 Tax=Candidatus Scalindua rubra TaxID=1872076 RepID=A0A1E3X8K9_9BACT|nr:MAG: hypothetical protein SCARUB_02933 [Candidatus Scalindua rubra]